MKDRIRLLLGEILRTEKPIIIEAEDSIHLLDRVRGRIDSMMDEDLNPQVKQQILMNLDKVLTMDLPPNKSFGILLNGA